MEEDRNIYQITDNEVEIRAKEILSDIGIDVKEAFQSFLQLIADKTIEPSILIMTKDYNDKLPISTAKGIFEGQIWMAEDFNETPDEIKEYL